MFSQSSGRAFLMAAMCWPIERLYWPISSLAQPSLVTNALISRQARVMGAGRSCGSLEDDLLRTACPSTVLADGGVLAAAGVERPSRRFQFRGHGDFRQRFDGVGLRVWIWLRRNAS